MPPVISANNHNIYIRKPYNTTKSTITFGSATSELFSKNPIKTLSPFKKALAWLVQAKETKEGLSHTRFIQDVSTNWFPKALFSRSKADFAEMTFLEYAESALFYYASSLFGEKILRNRIFSKLLPEHLKGKIAEPVSKLLADEKLNQKGDIKSILPIKAALVLSCTCIPAAEYALSFAKNLFTLKFFKKADFNNIANLEKNKKEDPEHQENVKKSAYKNIKGAGIASLIGIGAAIAVAAFGRKSTVLQSLSKTILEPGARLYSGLEKLGIKSEKLKNTLEKYIRLDFDSTKDGKLCLSNGQLTVSVLSGVAGYFCAAKDRGKLDFLEVATRVPIVAIYTIFGSSALETQFLKYLDKKGTYKDLIYKNKDGKFEVKSLLELAEKFEGKANSEQWLNVFKRKAFVQLTPFAFSIAIMGFLLAGINRFWTQYRFNHGVGQANKSKNISLKGTPQSLNRTLFNDFYNKLSTNLSGQNSTYTTKSYKKLQF